MKEGSIERRSSLIERNSSLIERKSRPIEKSWPVSEGLFSDWVWPETQQVALLLDSIAINDLPRWIYTWSHDRLNADWLYIGTPWEPAKARSPWLVYLRGPEDPILQHFLSQESDLESGYLLVTSGAPRELGDLMRHLLQIERAPGVPELLRIGHPFIAHRVIGQRLLRRGAGLPITAIITPDVLQGCWNYVPRTGEGESASNSGSKPQLQVDAALLDEFRAFDRRQAGLAYLREASASVQNWLGPGTMAERFGRLETVLGHARQWAFDSPRTRHLFIECLSDFGIRPWLREGLPARMTEAMKRASPGMGRLEAARQSLETP